MQSVPQRLPLLAASAVALAAFTFLLPAAYDGLRPLGIAPHSQLAQVAGGTTYYVSPLGDDSGPGTLSQPWKTIERAFQSNQATHLSGGDTLYIRNGEYRFDEGNMAPPWLPTKDSLSGTPSRPTVIAGYPGERPIIFLSSRISSGWERYTARSSANIWSFDYASYVTANHPYLAGRGSPDLGPGMVVPQIVAIHGTPPTLLQEVNSAKNALENTNIRTYRTDQDDMIAGDFYYESNTSSPNYGRVFIWLPDGSDPNGRPIEIGLDKYFNFGEQHDMNISNMVLRYSNRGALDVFGTNIQFDNIDASYQAFSGIDGLCTSCTVTNSTFVRNGNVGAGLQGNNTRYINNTFEDDNYRGYYAGWHCGGIKFIGGYTNVTMRGNTFRNINSCPGLWFDTMGPGHLVEKNTFISSDYLSSGLMVEITQGTPSSPILIRNNIFDGPMNLFVSGSSYVYAFNNLFTGGRGVAMHGLNCASPGRQTLTNNISMNNLVYANPYPNIGPFVAYIVSDVPAGCTATGNQSDYNLFYSPTGNMLFGETYTNPTRFSLAEWRARGYDVHSTTTDPLLSSFSSKNWIPRSGSPLIGAGMITPYVTDDFNGNPRTGRNDIGPFQAPYTIVTTVTAATSTNTTSTTTTPLLASSSPQLLTLRSSARTNTAILVWTTNIPTTAQADYGLTSEYGKSTPIDYTMSTTHSQTISSLTSDTLYHFRVKSSSPDGSLVMSPDFTFRTAKASATSSMVQAVVNQPIAKTPTQLAPAPAPKTTPSTSPAPKQYTDSVQTPIERYKVDPIVESPTRLSRTLQIGDSGADVRLLQQALNSLGYTVADTGPGSTGEEYAEFDANTQAALMRYQQDYKTSGINATGYLDNLTITLLNHDMYEGKTSVAIAESGTAVTEEPNIIEKIFIAIGEAILNIVSFFGGGE